MRLVLTGVAEGATSRHSQERMTGLVALERSSGEHLEIILAHTCEEGEGGGRGRGREGGREEGGRKGGGEGGREEGGRGGREGGRGEGREGGRGEGEGGEGGREGREGGRGGRGGEGGKVGERGRGKERRTWEGEREVSNVHFNNPAPTSCNSILISLSPSSANL